MKKAITGRNTINVIKFKGVNTMDAGKAIIKELDSRLKKLEKHYSDKKDTDGNPQAEMIAAESKIINAALANELRSLKEFVHENITD